MNTVYLCIIGVCLLLVAGILNAVPLAKSQPPKPKDPHCKDYMATPGEPCKNGLKLWTRAAESYPLCVCETQ